MNPYENKSLKTKGIKLLLLLLFPLLFSLQSYASPIKGDKRSALSFGENGEYLDAEQYAKDNPDVLEAYGMNPSAFGAITCTSELRKDGAPTAWMPLLPRRWQSLRSSPWRSRFAMTP